jgi:hypothetical protein
LSNVCAEIEPKSATLGFSYCIRGDLLSLRGILTAA